MVLIDGEKVSIVGDVRELLTITGLAQDGIRHRRRDGGVSPRAVAISKALTAEADRAWAAMSHVRHENATLAADEPESEPSRSQVIKVSEAARRHEVDPRTILRWMKRDPSMIISDHPYRLDPIALDAYAADRPRRKGRQHGA